ncbi:unnamed protein product [Allacma fusca]|uniref:Uncharacterized protein n=1 Tax=Allacma fusca TaxID=39272 RepID=A0A8J2JRR4_9HEXA|nr:unnamed protein product [Allacma fusca]
MARRVCAADTTHILILAVLIAVISTTTVAQKLIVKNLIDPNEKYTLEPGPDYHLKNLDIIWNISYPVEITFSSLDIDHQSGDFVVICEYPLPQGDKFSEGAPAEEVISELPIEESLLLTSNVLDEHSDGDKRLVIRVRSEHGAFVYFHGIKQREQASKGTSLENDSKITAEKFEGFLAQVEYLDLDPPPPVTTTTERLTTPAPGVDVYLFKHVIGRTPNEFYQSLDQFKEIVAKMGNDYCDYKKIKLQHPIGSTNGADDIRLDNTTIFFCDRQIKYYEVCVQIQLAITVRNTEGQYVMTTPVMEEMWNMYAKGRLANIGGKPMQPFDPEPEKPSVTWVWIASSLGVVLTLSTLLCFVFASGMIKSTHEPVRTNGGLERKQSIGSSYTNQKDPVLQDIIGVLRAQQKNDDAELMGMAETGHQSNRSSMSMPKMNPLHNMKSFDNPAFVHDENRGSFRSPTYYRGIPSGNGSSSSGHHTFQAQVHNNMSTGQDEIDSDEEMEIYNSAPGMIF